MVHWRIIETDTLFLYERYSFVPLYIFSFVLYLFLFYSLAANFLYSSSAFSCMQWRGVMVEKVGGGG